MAKVLDQSARLAINPAQGFGLRWADRFLLLGIALVTCALSLPRFHALMLSANEADARQAVVLFQDALQSRFDDLSDGSDGLSDGSDGTRTHGAVHLQEALANGELDRRFVDMRFDSPTGRIRYHGYQFAAFRDAEGYTLTAWPLQIERTGRATYVRTPRGPLLQTNDWSAIGVPPRWVSSPGRTIPDAPGIWHATD